MMRQRWAKAPAPREQLALFSVSLDEVVAQDHPIRRLERLLRQLDWSAWERKYEGFRGQPPIHPMLMAGCIHYGLMRKIRSSRALEEATRERVDFMWFLEGRSIDHSTFAKFRTVFYAELRDLNRQIGQLVCERYEKALLCLLQDGTRMRANSDRHGARTADSLEGLIQSCVETMNARLAELAEEDERGQSEGDTVERLTQEIERLEHQLAQYRRAHQVARERDEHKRRTDGNRGNPVRVPVTDPDSTILPNKEGGFAPNYTPTAAVDAETGIIVHNDVVPASDEASAVQPAVQEATGLLGRKPERVLADTSFGSGENLKALEEDGIEAYMPTNTDFRDTNPANRPDPQQPVAEELRQALPRQGKQLARSAFIYDETDECYYCPMGRRLKRTGTAKDYRSQIPYASYCCPGAAGCPLARDCVKENGKARTISRDIYQDVRDRVGRRMASEQGQAMYSKRAPGMEVVFAIIKHHMGIRYFLLRGIEKVRTEWAWICSAYNLKKVLGLVEEWEKACSGLSAAIVRLCGSPWRSKRPWPARVAWAA